MFKVNKQTVVEKVKQLAKQFTPKVLGSAKAIIAFVVAYVVTQLAQRGVSVDPVATVQLETGIYAFVVAVWTWWIPNKQ